MRAERTVLDTNILISAALTRGKAFEVLLWGLENGVLIFSDPTFEELSSRIRKSKFDPNVGIVRRRELLADLESVAEWTGIGGTLQACRDRDDDKFLETALAGQAGYFVTGDADLLALNPFEGVQIMIAKEFLRSISE